MRTVVPRRRSSASVTKLIHTSACFAISGAIITSYQRKTVSSRYVPLSARSDSAPLGCHSGELRVAIWQAHNIDGHTDTATHHRTIREDQ